MYIIYISNIKISINRITEIKYLFHKLFDKINNGKNLIIVISGIIFADNSKESQECFNHFINKFNKYKIFLNTVQNINDFLSLNVNKVDCNIVDDYILINSYNDINTNYKNILFYNGIINNENIYYQFSDGNIIFIDKNKCTNTSLIQTSIHSNVSGFIIFDSYDKLAKFIHLDNLWGYIKIDLINKNINQSIEIINNLPKYEHIIDCCVNTNYSNEEMPFEIKSLLSKYKYTLLHCPKKPNIESAIKNYIHNEKILINSDFIKNFQYTEIKWFPIQLSWANLYKFGPDNMIVFNNYINSIIKIDAPNNSGKTSIILIMLIALFGNNNMGLDMQYNVRNGEKYGETIIIINVNNDLYKIYRHIKSTKQTNECKIFKYDENTWKEIYFKEKILRENFIKSLIGNIEIFNNVNIVNNDLFIKNNKYRVDLLYDILMPFKINDDEIINKYNELKSKYDKKTTNDVDKYDNLKTSIQKCKDNIKKVNIEIDKKQKILNNFNVKKSEETILSEINKINNEIRIIKLKIQELKTTNNTHITQRMRDLYTMNNRDPCLITDEIDKINIKLKSINGYTTNTAQITDIITKLEKEYANININTVINYEELLSEITNKLSVIVDEKIIDNAQLILTLTNLKNNMPIFNDYCQQCLTIKTKFINDITQLELSLNDINYKNQTIIENNRKNKILKDELLTTQNNLLNEYKINNISKNKKKQLEDDILKNKEILNSLINANNNYKTILCLRDEKVKLENELKLSYEINAAKSIINKHNSSLNEEYLKNHDILTINYANLQFKLNLLNTELLSYKNNDFKNLQNEIKDYKNKLVNYSIELGTLLEQEKKYVENLNDSKKINLLEAKKSYEFVTRKVKYIIIKEYLNLLIVNVNNILNSIADFNINMNVIDKKIIKLKTYIINNANDRIPFELASGYQKFITLIALKISLMTIIPISCNILIIDEGFGCLDLENLTKIKDSLLRLKDLFKFIMIISHQDVNSIVDNFIPIVNTGAFSKINC